MKKKPKPKTRKPLTISIHGTGIDIDATISSGGVDDILTGLTKALEGRNAAPPPTMAPIGHDFDATMRVVEHAPREVLEAMLTLIMNKLGAEPAPPVTDIGSVPDLSRAYGATVTGC